MVSHVVTQGLGIRSSAMCGLSLMLEWLIDGVLLCRWNDELWQQTVTGPLREAPPARPRQAVAVAYETGLVSPRE
jgi:hypothetical protein